MAGNGRQPGQSEFGHMTCGRLHRLRSDVESGEGAPEAPSVRDQQQQAGRKDAHRGERHGRVLAGEARELPDDGTFRAVKRSLHRVNPPPQETAA